MTSNEAIEINKELHRNLASGDAYNHLMPYSDCSSITLGKGDTSFGVNNMAIWARKYQHHTKELATVFKGQKLKDLAFNLHSFLYNHFQYKIDGSTQKLRSPACCWFGRKEGIDCKSYSIFASTVLLNLGISHFIRRIKLSAESGFSHVYVVVSNNQNKPKDLSNGYYTVDGTLDTVEEPVFFEKDDLYMEAELTYEGLAGIVNTVANVAGSDNGTQAQPFDSFYGSLSDGLADLLDLGFKALINELTSCKNPQYNSLTVQFRLEKELVGVLKEKLDLLSRAIYWNSRTRIQFLFNDIFKELDLGMAHLEKEVAYFSGKKCEVDVLKSVLQYTKDVVGVVDTFYENFKSTQTSFDISETTKDGSTIERTIYFVVENSDNPTPAKYRFIILRDIDDGYAVKPVLDFNKPANEWLLENQAFLKNTYNDGREKGFAIEVMPFLEAIEKLREEFFLGGQFLYLKEKPLHEEIYKLWLQYDYNYADFLFQEAQDFKTANELAFQDFEIRFAKEIKENIETKELNVLIKTVCYSALAFGTFLIIKKQL